MREPTRLKKSESLEIRIPHPTKQAFMERCRRDGLSASEALRGFIERRIEEPPPVVRAGARKGLRLAAGVVIAAAMGAVALPSLARPSAREAFVRLDADDDNRISPQELSRGASVEATVRLPGARVTLGDDTTAAKAAELHDYLAGLAFRRMDRDGDGEISFDEFAEGGPA